MIVKRDGFTLLSMLQLPLPPPPLTGWLSSKGRKDGRKEGEIMDNPNV